MRCEKCRYLGKENFENTTMRTCNVLYYIINKLKEEGWKNLYTTDALRSEDSHCEIELIIRKWDRK